MLYLKSLLWIFSINGLLVLLFKKAFEKTVILSFTIASLFLYIFSIIGNLKLGYYLTWIFVLLFWILFIKLLISKDKEKILEFKNNYLRPSSLSLLFVLIYLFIRYHNQGFSQCDDFMHWGPMVISSLRDNGFYLHSEILKVHHDYPPFLTLYRMLWVGFNNFEYSETYLFVSQLVFYFSCLLPLYSLIDNKQRILKTLVLTISLFLLGLCIPMTLTAQEWALMYNSIYLDFVLVVYSAYILIFILNDEDILFRNISLALSLSALLLFKQIGICYFLLVIFYLFAKRTINKDFSLSSIPFSIIIPLLFFVSWSLLVKNAGISGQFEVNEMKFGDVLLMFNHKDGYLYKIFSLFVRTLLTRRLMYNIPFFVFVFLIAIIISIINLKKNYLYSITYILGSFAYALIMALLYMLSFDPVEAEVLASFDRYILSYEYFGIVLLFILVIIDLANKEFEKKKYLYPIFIALLLFSVEWKSFDTLLPHKLDKTYNSSVLIVDSVDGFVTYREELNGLNFEFIDSKLNNGNIKEEEFLNEVKDNDFLYINEYNPDFYEKYWPILKQDFDPYTKVLYEIKNDNNVLTLIPLHVHYNARVLEYYIIPK